MLPAPKPPARSANTMSHRTSNRPAHYFRRSAPRRRMRFSLHAAIAAALLYTLSPARANQPTWDFAPYHIQIIIAIDAPGGTAEHLSRELPEHIQRRIESALVPLWSCEVHCATGAEQARAFADAAASSDPQPPDFPPEKDKRILASIRWTPDSFKLTAREFDRFVQRWSVPIRRESRQEAALPDQLFALIWQTFSPVAQIDFDAADPKTVKLKLRGASLPRAADIPLWIKPGDVFLPFVRRTARGGELEKNGIRIIPWTYIEASEVNGNTISGRIESANRRPFAGRRQGRVEQFAIGLRGDPDITTLRLQSRSAEAKPLADYEVFSQKPGEESLARIGLSDSTGRLRIPPGKTSVQFILVKHGQRLLARFPMVAGNKPDLDIRLPDDGARLSAEAYLAAVREDLIDVVAQRNILIARARQKMDKKDFAAADELLRTLDDLPARPQFNPTLDTAARLLRSDDPQMQRRIDQLFESTRTLLTQYLDVRPINELHDELREAERNAGEKTNQTRKNAQK
jgi:hypothetical protein